MRILVLGASGRVGRLVVEQALEAGHEVTAFLRDPSKLELRHERLRVARGDAREAERLREAVRGQDAVVSAVGHTRTSGERVLTELADNLVPAMREAGVRRLVSLVGAGVPDPEDPASLGRSIMRGAMKLLAGGMLADAEAHAERVRASGLDWTLVRPPRLVDGPRTGRYRTGTLQLGPRDRIARADVADYLLRLATSDEGVRRAPMVAA